MNKKRLIGFVAPLLLVIAIADSIKSEPTINANEMALEALKLLSGNGVEYKSIGKSSEHYRDTVGGREVAISYRADGSIENKIIVDQSGKRVTSIGYDEEGKAEAFTWTLPNDIAEENKILLQESLLKDFKDQLTSENWEKAKDPNVIKVTKDKTVTYVHIHEKNTIPIKKETFNISNDKENLISSEEYMLKSTADSEFKIDVPVKEIVAP
ncbi:hypothetical protein J2T17_007143 [Paenibacillus mucilaginosus]|uniref:hypothetical protein n=1 Tax=Paenibacillus mucilaginosus TaxID=61624 RepID=UPI003D1DD530